MLSAHYPDCRYAECRSAQCNAEYRCALNIGADLIQLRHKIYSTFFCKLDRFIIVKIFCL